MPLGPNGDGKTMLIRTLLGMSPPSGDTVRLEGRDIALGSSSVLSRPTRLLRVLRLPDGLTLGSLIRDGLDG